MKISEFFVRTHSPVKGQCFVLMPFASDMQLVYEHGIKPLVESMSLRCKRGDEIYSENSILGDIWKEIQASEIIIADLTGKNPNVMYELGLCHALWKKVILLSQNSADIPFDLKVWRVILYDYSFEGSARLKDELMRAIQSIRAEDTFEAALVPYSGKGTGNTSQPDPDGRWEIGTIKAWYDRGFGFIKADSCDYHIHGSHLVSGDAEPLQGRQVLFLPGPPISPGKQPNAKQAFVLNCNLRGTICKLPVGKSFGFVRLDPSGSLNDLLLLIRPDDHFEIGDFVEGEVTPGDKGPILRNARVVTDPE